MGITVIDERKGSGSIRSTMNINIGKTFFGTLVTDCPETRVTGLWLRAAGYIYRIDLPAHPCVFRENDVGVEDYDPVDIEIHIVR